MTALAQRTTDLTAPGAEPRDVRAWEAAVRRVVRADRAELVDGSRAQRHRLVATGVRHGVLRAPRAPLGTQDLSRHRLTDLLTPEHSALWAADASTPVAPAGGSEATVLAEVMARFTGVARGRALWVVPFAARGAGGAGPALGVLATDSPLAVLALQEVAEVGTTALARVEAGEPWTALVHSVGLPLVDEHGHVLRDDVAWPRAERWSGRLRGGAEVWSCGSPVVPA